MIYRKLIVLVSLLIGFVNIAFAGVGDLDTLNVRSQAPVKERMPVVAYKFNPKSLILPASLITVGAVGTAIDGMNDFHLFSRKDSVKQIHIDNYLEWGMLGWVFVCDLMGTEKHNWVDQLCLVALAEGMNGLMVHGLKNWVNEPRPDGAPYSFPSGHMESQSRRSAPAAAFSNAGQGAVSPEKTKLSPCRAGPRTASGRMTRPPSSVMLSPCWSVFHCFTGTPNARACSGENRPARGRSSR